MTRAGLLSLLLVEFTAPIVAADAVRVSSLVRDGRVWISFELADGYSPEVR